MRQKVTFTADLYIEADGFDWNSAAEAVKTALVYGAKHQDYSLILGRVTGIAVDDEE
jgi:hypothetical protein